MTTHPRAAAIPAGSKAVSEWFPPKERPLATSAFQMGTSLGNMIAPPLVAFCILYWGWQSAFLVTGSLSLVWAAGWWFALAKRIHAPQEQAKVILPRMRVVERPAPELAELPPLKRASPRPPAPDNERKKRTPHSYFNVSTGT